MSTMKSAWISKMQSPPDIDLEHTDPMSVIALERDSQRKLCTDLERLADALGGPVEARLCSSLRARLLVDLPRCCLDEEALFRLMLARKQSNASFSACVHQAVSQHSAMQAYVFELLEPLNEMSEGATPRNLDVVGYMLRFCFDGIRHHLQWEDAAIFQDAAAIGSTIDIELLRQAMLSIRAIQT
jgi:hypothetical protein